MTIQNELNKIKNAIFGKDVRDALHDGLEKGYTKAEEAESNSLDIKETYDEILMSWNSDPNKDPEVISARGGLPQLEDRLDKTDAELAQTVVLLGDKEEGETDDTGRIQRLIDSLNSNQKGLIPYKEEPYDITGVTLKTGVTLEINRSIRIHGEGNTGLDLTGCLYVTVQGNARILLQNENQIGIYIGGEGALGNAQLNVLRGIGVEGYHHKGTTSLVLENTWVNNFYDCFWFRSQDGIKFIGSHTNANNFYGCEVRGIRDHENSGLAILQDSGGQGNNFHGGAVENYRDGIRIKRGHLAFYGTWIEGFGFDRRIFLEGGSLTFKGCEFLALIKVTGGVNLTFEDNRIPGTYDAGVLNINYPLIRFFADVPTKVYTKGNKFTKGAYLTRWGMYAPEGGTFTWRSDENIHEISTEYQALVNSSLNTDTNNIVAGSGNGHIVRFNNNFLNRDGLYSNGYFNTKHDGYYRVKANVRLKNISGAFGRALMSIRTAGGATRTLDYQSITTRTNEGFLNLQGSTVVRLRANEWLHIETNIFGDLTEYGIVGGSSFQSQLEVERIHG